MSGNTDEERQNRATEEAAQAAMTEGGDIRAAVRDITLKALSEGQLERERIRQVVQAVMQGASLGAADMGTPSRAALRAALNGIDEALAKSAEASKLAIEEAAGHLKDFGQQDLKRALDDLLALEDMLLDTVKNVAGGSGETVAGILTDLAQHARNSGTAVGETALQAADGLRQNLGQTLRETVSAGTDAALTVGAQLAQAAAGFLEGIAARLQPGDKDKPGAGPS